MQRLNVNPDSFGTTTSLATTADQTGTHPGEHGSETKTSLAGQNQALVRNTQVVDACLRRLNASRRKATENDWTEDEMRQPEFLRPIWALNGDKARLRQALSLTCSLSEAGEAMRELLAMTHLAASRQDDPGDMIERYARRLTEYPPLVVLEVVSDWATTEEFFPRAWVLLKDRLDMVRGSLEALAK